LRSPADIPGVSTSRQRVVAADQWGKPDRNAAGEPICRWCRGPVTPPRRTFCGDACVHEWKIRSSPWYVRREVKKRDKGICRLCGLNVVKAHREWTRAKPAVADRAARRRWRADRPRWEADHIVPVADGGGECGLENYRLLCRPCHVRVTLDWRARRPPQISARGDNLSDDCWNVGPRASEPRERASGAAKRRASDAVGESEERSPSESIGPV
jgi:5-methylcytosine-specific restriction enzyme A